MTPRAASARYLPDATPGERLALAPRSGIGLYLIGIPYAVLWGSVAGMLRFVPYVGAVVSGLLPFTLSLAVFDSWTKPLLILLLFTTLELVTGNFLEPWLYGIHTTFPPWRCC